MVGCVHKQKMFFLLNPYRQKIIDNNESPVTLLAQTDVVKALWLDFLVEQNIGDSWGLLGQNDEAAKQVRAAVSALNDGCWVTAMIQFQVVFMVNLMEPQESEILLLFHTRIEDYARICRKQWILILSIRVLPQFWKHFLSLRNQGLAWLNGWNGFSLWWLEQQYRYWLAVRCYPLSCIGFIVDWQVFLRSVWDQSSGCKWWRLILFCLFVTIWLMAAWNCGFFSWFDWCVLNHIVCIRWHCSRCCLTILLIFLRQSKSNVFSFLLGIPFWFCGHMILLRYPFVQVGCFFLLLLLNRQLSLMFARSVIFALFLVIISVVLIGWSISCAPVRWLNNPFCFVDLPPDHLRNLLLRCPL